MSFEITRPDIPLLAVGSSVLACGGGGNPYYGQLTATHLFSDATALKVIDLDEMAPAELAVCPAIMGAPLVMIEKPPSLIALRSGLDSVKHWLGDRVGAFVAIEAGGFQSMLPLLLSGLTGVPLLDGDGMGRAFPEAQMCTFLLYGISPSFPVAISDDHGLLWWIPPLPIKQLGGTSRSGGLIGKAVERVFRRYCARKGGAIYFTLTIDQPSLRRTLVRGSLSLALGLGRAIASARASGEDPSAALCRVSGGKLLFCGKIVDAERRSHGGHDWGTLRLDGLNEDRGRRAELSFKNEYLILRIDGEVTLTVPDLITLVEPETGMPITTEVAREGLRASILGLRCSPLYRTPEALRVVGPRAFGYDLPDVSLPDDDESSLPSRVVRRG